MAAFASLLVDELRARRSVRRLEHLLEGVVRGA
jgi:hypothetical protein